MAHRTPVPEAPTAWTCWICKQPVPDSSTTCPCQGDITDTTAWSVCDQADARELVAA